MILYFSGTGNSLYIAERIARALTQEMVSLNEKIKNSDYTLAADGSALIFVLPTYCYRIPRIVEKWIRQTPLERGARAWFLMDCGEDAGNAGKYLRKLCSGKGLIFMGLAEIVMPENYTALYDTPDREAAVRIIQASEDKIDSVIEMIRRGEELPPPRVTIAGRMYSSFINFFFYKLIVKDRKFRAGDSCTGCGNCAELCPLNNISIEGGRPRWHGDCTHCMACINHCPRQAIEYGKASEGRNKYTCPL